MKIDSKKLKASLRSIRIKGKDALSKAYNRGVKASIQIIRVYEAPALLKQKSLSYKWEWLR